METQECSYKEEPGHREEFVHDDNRPMLFWMFTPLWVSVQAASIVLAALAWVAVGEFHVRILTLVLGFAGGLLLGLLPAIVWFRVADRLNEKYLRQPILAIVSWSTPEQQMIGASAMLAAFLLLVVQILYWNSGEAAANDSGLIFGAGLGGMIVWGIAYVRWYRKRRS